MYVILSGRLAVAGRDAVGQALPVAAFAEMMSAALEDLAEVVPGEVLAEIGALSGQHSVSVIDAKAVGEVEAILVPPEGLRALLIAEAELGERILRALILRRVASFSGPPAQGSPETREQAVACTIKSLDRTYQQEVDPGRMDRTEQSGVGPFLWNLVLGDFPRSSSKGVASLVPTEGSRSLQRPRCARRRCS